MRRSPVFAAVIAFDTLFLLLIGWTAMYNRLAADDFYFLTVREREGPLGMAGHFWNEWTGRWASTLVIGNVAAASMPGAAIGAYTLATVAVLSLSLALPAGALSERLFARPLSLLERAAYGVFAAGVLFFSTRDVGEVWFWLSGSATYLWPLAMLFAGLALLVPERPKPVAVAAAALLFALFPGFNDSLAVIALPVLGGALLLSARPGPDGDPRPLWRRAVAHPLFVPLVCCALSWLVTTQAPGHRVRIASYGGIDVARGLKMTLVTGVKGGAYLLLFHGYGLLTAFAAGLVVGARNRVGGSLAGLLAPRRLLRLTALAVLAVTVLTLLPTNLVYGFAVDRVYVHMSVAFAVAALVLGWCVAQEPRRSALAARVGALGLAAAVLAPGVYLAVAAPSAARYARAFDARLALLRKEKAAGRTAPAALSALPAPFPLHIGEVSPDPKAWRNTGVQEGLGLPFPVYTPEADPDLVN